MQVAVGVGQFDIHAGFDGERAGFLLIRGDRVAVGIGTKAEFPNGEVIGNDEALEAPLLAQHIAEQPTVGVRWHAVDLVVGGHDADGAGLAQRLAKCVEEGLAQNAQRDIGRSAIHAGLGLSVADKMLERGDEMTLVLKGAISLEPAHRGDAKPRNQKWIFAECLFHPAPTRLARHVDHGRKCLMRSTQADLGGRHGVQLLNQFGIEGGAERDGLRKAGSVHRGVAVQAFLVEDDGDSQPAVFYEKLLNGVGQGRHPSGVQALACIAGAAHLAQAAAVAERCFSLFFVEVSVAVYERLRLLLPDAKHLRSLLLQGHSREQVFDPPRRGKP